MRQVFPKGFRRVGADALARIFPGSRCPPANVVFESDEGSLLLLHVLDHHLIRVRNVPLFCRPFVTSTICNSYSVRPDLFLPRDSFNTVPTSHTSNNGIHRSNVHQHFPCPTPKITDLNPSRPDLGCVIETEELRVRVSVSEVDGDLTLRWYTTDAIVDEPFMEDLSFRAYQYDLPPSATWNVASNGSIVPFVGGGVHHFTVRRPGDVYYGMGEHASPMALNGRRVTLSCLDSLGYDAERTDPLYKQWPFIIAKTQSHTAAEFADERPASVIEGGPRFPGHQRSHPHSAFHGVYYDAMTSGSVDFGQEIDALWGFYRRYSIESPHTSGGLDYYVLGGSRMTSVGEVVKSFAELVGRPVIPPKFAFGYLASAMGYAEVGDAQEKIEGFAEKCKANRIPCDLLHLSSGYTVDEFSGARNVFTWNERRFPNPAKMCKKLRDNGIRIVANVKPWLLSGHPSYGQEKKFKCYIWNPETNEPSVTRLWSAGEGETSTGSYFDFTSNAGRKFWKDGVKALLELGIEGIWNDNNEYSLHDDEHMVEMEALGTEKLPVAVAGRPLQTLMMATASYEAMVEKFPNKRPFLITRSAVTGIQRYASQTWSGDNYTSWHTLKHNVPMGLSASLSLVCPAGYGHDVGGFVGPSPEPRLFLRWVQNGIWHPRFCIHSWKKEGVTEPWMHPEVLDHIRASIYLRYQLVPYLYSLAQETAATGAPMIRPTMFHFPNDPQTYPQALHGRTPENALADFQFMLGPWLLIASALDPGVSEDDTVSVYLPSGTVWCDFWNHTWIMGGTGRTLSELETAYPPLLKPGVAIELSEGDNGHELITQTVPLSQPGAVFVRAGALIPTGKVTDYIGAEPDNLRTILAFPPPALYVQLAQLDCGVQMGEGVLGRWEYLAVEDDGETANGPKTEVVYWMEVRGSWAEQAIAVGAHVLPGGKYDLPYKKVVFSFDGGEQRPIVGGAQIGDAKVEVNVSL
ncbi:glycosyl hydrolases family 31-domain-containing protein [Cladochytrium replicatum]|nr:glycosyl hydrolases family 31-domain-containing protein [Cladochytrium replicatum]